MKEDVFFTNIKRHIISLLSKSRYSITIAVAWFTDTDIIWELEECAERGVNISILINDDKINNKRMFKRLSQYGCRIKTYNSYGLMHNKFCIIDNRIIITGSYNWTYNAQSNNRENITVLSYDPSEFDKRIVNKFKDEFEKLFSQAKDIVAEIPDLEVDGLIYYGNNVWADSRGVKYIKDFDEIILLNYPKDVKRADIGRFVTDIAERAFEDCTELKEVVFPQNLRKIGKMAFKGCKSLRSIAIPKNVTVIRDSCFYGCENLEYVTLLEVEIIESNSFANCKKLRSIRTSSTLKSIGKNAFENCETLTSINLFAASVDTYAFAECKAMTTVKMSTKEISEGCFRNCLQLKEIDLKNIEIIGNNAFKGCESLVEVQLPAIRVLGHSVFCDCKKLKEVTLSSSVKIMGCGIFYGCSSLETFDWPSSIRKIPDSTFAFSGLKRITNPTSVYSIGNKAFYWSKFFELESYSNLEEIGESAFENSRMNKIMIPANVKVIHKKAFDTKESYHWWSKEWLEPINISLIENVVIPPSCISCELNYKYMILPLHLKRNDLQQPICYDDIKVKGSEYCYDTVQEITLSDGIQEIPDYKFCKWENLSKVQLPKSIVTIGKWAFAYTNLSHVDLPSNLRSLGANSFFRCENLSEIVIPSNTTIPEAVFVGCAKLSQIVLSSDNKKYKFLDGVLYTYDMTTILFCDCSKIRNIIPSSVIRIGDGAFWGHSHLRRRSHLRKRKLPKSSLSIGRDSTIGKHIYLPHNIQEIGVGNFGDMNYVGMSKKDYSRFVLMTDGFERSEIVISSVRLFLTKIIFKRITSSALYSSFKFDFWFFLIILIIVAYPSLLYILVFHYKLTLGRLAILEALISLIFVFKLSYPKTDEHRWSKFISKGLQDFASFFILIWFFGKILMLIIGIPIVEFLIPLLKTLIETLRN